MASGHLLACLSSLMFMLTTSLLSTIPQTCNVHAHLVDASLTNKRAVTVGLIHRDSHRSPYYDPSLTTDAWRTQAASRSRARAKNITQRLFRQPTTDAVLPPILHPSSWFVVDLMIGTPPVRLFFIVDTGSELTWTQCKPCDDGCYRQDPPMFDPSNSSSYVRYDCLSDMCIPSPYSFETDCENGECHFGFRYVGSQSISGTLANETLTFSSTKFEHVPIGCVSEARGSFGPLDQGLLGLANADMGFAHSPGVDGRFAICLPQYDDPEAMGTLVLGEVGFGSGTVSTAMVNPDSEFYVVTVEGAMVGTGGFDSSFNVVVDSGCIDTYLPAEFLKELDRLVKDATGLQSVTTSPDGHYEYCYQTPGDVMLPHLVFKFAGPVNVTLPPETVFRWVANDKVVCLVFLTGRFGNTFFWGASATVNVLVGYDLQARTINFTPMPCDEY